MRPHLCRRDWQSSKVAGELLVVCALLTSFFLVAIPTMAYSEGVLFVTSTFQDSSIVIPVNASPAERNRILRDAVEKLPDGRILDTLPDTMDEMESRRIVVRITRDYRDSLFWYIEDQKSVKLDSIKVSARMKVILSGSDFEISPASEPEQLIFDRSYTEWVFQVTPKNHGMCLLSLSVVALLEPKNGRQEIFQVPVKTKDVFVYISYAHHANDVAPWAAIFIPIVIALVKWKSLRKWWSDTFKRVKTRPK
jgi:hypothetical protein